MGLNCCTPCAKAAVASKSAAKGNPIIAGLSAANSACCSITWGLVVAWDCAGANAPDTAFHPLIATFEEEMIVLSDSAFHAKEGDPANLKLCDRGLWNTRMLVETVLSMLTGVCHLKKVAHRTWAAFQTRLAFTLATFNLLVQWHGLKPDAHGFIHLSLAEFSL